MAWGPSAESREEFPRTLQMPIALPGEKVVYERVNRRRGVDEGRLIEVLEAHPERVEPPCEHYAMCGGCSLMHLDPRAQIRLKQSNLLGYFNEEGVEPEQVWAPLLGPQLGYRRKARLGVRLVRGKGRVLVGFRERDKRFVADMRRCVVLAAPAGELLEPLGELIGSLSIADRVPQVEIAVGDDATALVLRVLEPLTDEDMAKLRAFEEAHRQQPIRLFLQPGGLDTVAPLDGGGPHLAYAVTGDVTLAFAPTDFVQVNADLNRAMIARAIDLLAIEPGQQVLDLFCGLGNFTLPIGRVAESVVGYEGDRGLVERARENARAAGMSHVRFEQADLYADPEAVDLSGRWDGVLLDPPRSGAEAIVRRLGPVGPPRIVYVACGPRALARDAAILVRDHGYHLRGVGVMDMFPHTAHVESIALLER